MKLLLVRHGHITSNLTGTLDTSQPGPGLTTLGWEQAMRLPHSFADAAIDSIHASTLIRTVETAQPLADQRNLPIIIHEGLREIDAGTLEMLGDPTSLRLYLGTARAWTNGHLARRMPGGTDGIEFVDRFTRTVNKIAASGSQYAVAFSHGAAIRVWVSLHCTNIPNDYGVDHELGNTGTVLLTQEENGDWQLLDWGTEAPVALRSAN